MTTRPSKAALDLARQLLDRETAGTLEAGETAAAIERTLARVSENLRRSVGDDGYTALLARAVAQTQTEHPALKDVRGDGSLVFPIDGRTADVGTHDVKVVYAAFESLLGSIVDMLSGLVGADMVLNLLDPDGTSPTSRRSGESQ